MQRPTATGLDLVQRKDDVLFENVAQEVLAILIIGPTGAGKSTFIRNAHLAIDSNLNPSLSHTLVGFTSRMAQYPFRVPSPTNPDRVVILVDTPSLDHKNVDALESLRQISSWLASIHTPDVNVRVGIVFMYPIFAGGLTRIDLAIFQIFLKLCGSRHFLRIIGITTKWDTCPDGRGEGREQAIWDAFWKEVGHGKQAVLVHRLCDSPESALAVFRSIVRQCESRGADRQPLSIQREILVEGKTFKNTAAAKLCTSLLIKKERDPRRYSLSRILMFRQATVPITSVIEAHPSDDDPANGGLGVNIAIWSSPESRQSGCTCLQVAERETLPDPVGEVPTNEDSPAPLPLEDFSESDPRFSVASSYYTVPTTPSSPVSDHRLSIASSYYTVPVTPLQERPIPVNSRTRTVSSHMAFAGSTTIPTIPENRDPAVPESVMINLDAQSSLSSVSSTATLPGQAPPSDTSSSPTLDGASSPPRSEQDDARERSRTSQNNPDFFRDASNFNIGEMNVQALNAQNVTIAPSININIAPNITINNFHNCPHHRDGRSSNPPRHSTI